jgi:hypothetical protein
MLVGRMKWFIPLLLLVLLMPAVSPALAAPDPLTIIVSPGSGVIGSSVSVTGSGAPASSPISIFIGNMDGTSGQVVATTSSGPKGNFGTSFTLNQDLGLSPSTVRGIWAVANPGTASKVRSNIVPFTITFGISVSPVSAPLGTVVTVASTGAPANVPVTIFVGNTDGTGGVVVATVQSGDLGHFSKNFTLGQVGDIEPNSDIGIWAVANAGTPQRIRSAVFIFEVTGTTNEPIVFSNLSPAPWTTVGPGSQTIGATVVSGGTLTGVTLQLSGVGTIQSVGNQNVMQETVTTVVVLGPGTYTATMLATDSNGRQFVAQWDFTVGSPGESQWFNADGTVKSAEFNATTQSLVQAFRYHLFGQSWDGSVHPELPTHASTITGAEPLGVWSPQNGAFNQQYTQATLQSLVQAFRWHLFGISWQTVGTPDMVTHATVFTGPQPIQPWFDANGNPNRANIEATLKSLVQAMRWHFWGYTWDGAHHHDIPTHQPGV